MWVCENQDFYSPMLFGVRNTKVLIPQEMLETENYSYEEWYLIFLHELTHQKKHDLWYKRFLQIIRDVYWFCIPMLWVQKMANIDIECVCDETVTKHMNLTQRKDYCNVILKVASKQTKKELSGVVSMVSETEILKERFYNVFLARKKTSNIRHCFSFWNNYFEFFGNANSATNMVIIAYRKLSQMQSCGTRRSGLECMGK
ncbi:MAG: M56 family metallopeptidase [Fusicatenibacter saccharivorans]